MIINKYTVKMFQDGSNNLARSRGNVIASSPDEAIESVRHDKWWYDEGTGYNYKALKYPLRFEATINND